MFPPRSSLAVGVGSFCVPTFVGCQLLHLTADGKKHGCWTIEDLDLRCRYLLGIHVLPMATDSSPAVIIIVKTMICCGKARVGLRPMNPQCIV
jgi:hypothetical protein